MVTCLAGLAECYESELSEPSDVRTLLREVEAPEVQSETGKTN